MEVICQNGRGALGSPGGRKRPAKPDRPGKSSDGSIAAPRIVERLPEYDSIVAARRWFVAGLSAVLAAAAWLALSPYRSAGRLDTVQIAGCAVYLTVLVMGLFNLLLYVLGGWLWGKGDTGCGAPAMAEDTGDWVKSRVAIVMPIYHEATERVYAGVMQTWESVKRQGLDRHCDFFLLCDSTEPAYREREEEMYRKLLPGFDCNRSGAGRLFLLRRADRRNFKAGNIMNFLDKHGDGYDFMLVLDADSVMLGGSIQELILTLQEHPRVGILQTLMIPIRSVTPFARAMQYSTARCLPLYAKGMLWFYDRDSVYWGHNALIRVAPFRQHCRLPTLPGKPPLGGTIMSQDIVEAAFIGRAGWEVGWVVDGGGSFDELPPNILAYGRRDRRWCQGNFQHYRFILAPGIRFGHRLYFANGIFAYLASPLLLLLILLGLVQGCLGAAPAPDPWLCWASMGLFWFQMLTPRLLGLIGFSRRRAPSPCSASPKLSRRAFIEAISTVADLVLNLLIGPVIFYLHTRFIVEILSGRHVVWKNQSRNPRERVSWATAARVFWLPSVLGLLGAAAAWRVSFPLTLLILPVPVSWLLSIPLAVLTSDPTIGSWLTRMGLFPDALTTQELEHLGPLARDSHVGRPLRLES